MAAIPARAGRRQQRVRVAISGGREDGFRFYTTKTAPRPGQWRVNILTVDGRVDRPGALCGGAAGGAARR